MKTKLSNFGLFTKVIQASEQYGIGDESAYIAFSYLSVASIGKTAQRILYEYMKRYVRMLEGRYTPMAGQKIIWDSHKYIRCPESYLVQALGDRGERTIRRARKQLADSAVIQLHNFQLRLYADHEIVDSASYVEIRQEILDVYHILYLYSQMLANIDDDQKLPDIVDKFEAIAQRLENRKGLIVSIGQSCPIDSEIAKSSRTKIDENVLVSRTKIGKNVLLKDLYTIITKVYFSNSETSVSKDDSIESPSTITTQLVGGIDWDLVRQSEKDSHVRREMRRYMKEGAIKIHLWHRVLYWQLKEESNKPLKDFLLRIDRKGLFNHDDYEKKWKRSFFHSFAGKQPEEIWSRLIERMSEFDLARRRSFSKLIDDAINLVHQEMRERILDTEDKMNQLHYFPYLSLVPKNLRNHAFLDCMITWHDHARENQLGTSLARMTSLYKEFEGRSQEEIISAIRNSIRRNWKSIIFTDNGQSQSHRTSLQGSNRTFLNLRDQGSSEQRQESGTVSFEDYPWNSTRKE